MKIGIITYPFNNNYGGFLQAYALTSILKRMGSEVWFIDLQALPPKRVFIKNIIKKYLLRRENIFFSHRKEYEYIRLNKVVTWQHTQVFVDKYLCPKISPIYSSKDLPACFAASS